MNYPEFNSLSIAALLMSICSLALLYVFIKKYVERLGTTESKLNTLIKSFNTLRNEVHYRFSSNPNKKEKIDYMEGELDLVKEGKKATFKAIYYPKKVKRK